MSVALSPYLLPQALNHSKTPETDLLDALLASCQKSSMNPPLPGFGRSLQPYFAPDILAPRSASLPSKSGAQPPKNKGKAKKARSKHSNATSSSSSDEDAKQGPKVNTMKSDTKMQTSHNVNNNHQTIKAIHKSDKAVPPSGRVWAGPSFVGMAPAVSEIPIPSDFLLA